MKNIAIFGSGKGSNAIKIIEYFKSNPKIQVNALVSNKPKRGFFDISYEYRINLEIISGNELSDLDWIKRFKDNYQPDLIVLAGFLNLIPFAFIQAFDRKIINVHPALLPDFGGKGMYGMNVHKAVKASGKNETGITIHYVNEFYDKGDIIFQQKCEIDNNDDPERIAQKIHQLEYANYSLIIEKLLLKQI